MTGVALFHFYRWILSPVVLSLLFLIRPLLRGKLREISDERQKHQWIFTKNPNVALKSPFWIHAASGEIEYARPLIRELKKNFPQIPLVVTYSSPSGKRILQRIAEVDAWGPSPWDSIISCQKFLSRVQPRAVFFSRTDVWPEISYQLRQKKIPAILFSATFAEDSSRLKGLSKYLTVWTLDQLQKVFVVSEKDQVQLQKVGFHKSIIGGDSRYDQVFYRLHHPQAVNEVSKPSGEFKIFVAGSTWPEDEKILFPWFIESRKNNSVKLLLAPHEISPTRLQKIVDFFVAQGLDCQFYSDNKTWTSAVLIVDQIGVLAELYSWAHAAFVGGSFRKQVHSVMEPLACGIPVSVGPFHKNNREALEFQTVKVQRQALVRCVQNVSDLESFWQDARALSSDDHLAIQQHVKARQGATQKISEAVSVSN